MPKAVDISAVVRSGNPVSQKACQVRTYQGRITDIRKARKSDIYETPKAIYA